MPLATAGEASVLTNLLTSRYISAHTADPTVGNEVVGNGYARVAGGTFSQSGNNPTTATNAAIIEFPVATGSWGTITHFGIYSALSGGNLLAYATLATSKAITTDDVLRFLAGELDVTAN